MTQEDKQKLQELMKSNSFEDIIDELLLSEKITSNDILNIAEDYWYNDMTPVEQIENIILDNQEIDDPEKQIRYKDIMAILDSAFPNEDLMNYFDNYDLIDHLEGTFALEDYVDNRVDDALYDKEKEYEQQINYLQETLNNAICSKSRILKSISKLDFTPDEVHKIICNLTNTNYYERNSDYTITELKKLANNNNYEVYYSL
jgi:hypothetical protein